MHPAQRTCATPIVSARTVNLELRRQRCRTVVKNPNRLVSSGPGTPPLPIHDGKSGKILGVRWNGGGTGTYLPETDGLHGVLATHRCDCRPPLNGHEGDSTFTNSCSWSMAPSCSSNVVADTGYPQKGKRRDAFTAKHSALGQQAGSLTRAWQAIPLTRNTPSLPHTSTVAAPLRVFGPFTSRAS